MTDARSWDVPLPSDLPYFEGHFEGDPVLPAVAALQWLALRCAREAWPDLGAPRRLAALKFRRALRPGDTVRVTLSRREQTLDFVLATDGVTAASGRVEFPPPSRA